MIAFQDKMQSTNQDNQRVQKSSHQGYAVLHVTRRKEGMLFVGLYRLHVTEVGAARYNKETYHATCK